MRILHVITGLDVGGAETMLYRLATRFDPARFESRVVSLIAPGVMGDRLVEAGIPVDTLSMRRGVPSPAGLARLVRQVRRYRPDVVQTWLYHADLAGLVAARLAFPLGTRPRVVWNIRCSFMALEEYRRLTGVTLRACAGLSGLPDAVLTNSHSAKHFHQDLGYEPKRFEVIPNGFDTDRFRPDEGARLAVRRELDLPPESLMVGHVARFDPMKDHRTLIRAAARVMEANPQAVFVLVGRGVDYDNLDLAAWIGEAGLDAERLRLLGERDDVARLMAAMDVHVSSSLGESFPNVVGEAMACGAVPVVTDVGDSARLAGDEDAVVPPADETALATALADRLGLGRDSLARLGQAARQRIVDRYSLDTVVARYAGFYESLS